MVLTSHKEMEDDKTTGVWLGEFTDPYFVFIDKGCEVTLASPKGGKPPVDPRSELTENITPSNKRFTNDEKAKRDFQNTKKLNEVNAQDFDAIFFPGGHGPMWDLSSDENCAKLVLDFYSQNKPVAAVCHGPAALIPAAEKDPGFLKGKSVTAFSNTEEKLAGLYNSIPFKLQDRLKELGANYHSATIPYTAEVQKDGLLITGQNPASAEPTANLLIEVLEKELVKK